MNKLEAKKIRKIMDLLDSHLGDSDSYLDSVSQAEIEEEYPVVAAAQIVASMLPDAIRLTADTDTQTRLKSTIDSAIIVYGPQGSGKTFHAPALAQFYGKSHIVDGDDWTLYDGHTPHRSLPADTLLTTCDEQFAKEHARKWGSRAIHIDEAVRDAGLSTPPGASHA